MFSPEHPLYRIPRADALREKYIRLAGLSDGTAKAYLIYIRQWIEWATSNGRPVVPAQAHDLAEFLYSKVRAGVKPQTLNVYNLAIASYHTTFGLPSPITEEVQNALSNIKREYGTPWKRTPGITRERLKAIEEVVYTPRLLSGNGNRLETTEKARVRGFEEIALIYFMRDALLRYPEVAASRWSHISQKDDGSGILTIRIPIGEVHRAYLSRNDSGILTIRIPIGEVHRAYLSRKTMGLLHEMRNGADDDPVFPLSWKQMTRRIKRTTKHAGLCEDYNLGSPRLGMAKDLLNSGEGLLAVMAAGRWKKPKMLLKYFGDEIAARNIEQFFK